MPDTPNLAYSRPHTDRVTVTFQIQQTASLLLTDDTILHGEVGNLMIRKRDPMLGILWIELGKVAGPKIMMKKV